MPSRANRTPSAGQEAITVSRSASPNAAAPAAHHVGSGPWALAVASVRVRTSPNAGFIASGIWDLRTLRLGVAGLPQPGRGDGLA